LHIKNLSIIKWITTKIYHSNATAKQSHDEFRLSFGRKKREVQNKDDRSRRESFSK